MHLMKLSGTINGIETSEEGKAKGGSSRSGKEIRDGRNKRKA